MAIVAPLSPWHRTFRAMRARIGAVEAPAHDRGPGPARRTRHDPRTPVPESARLARPEVAGSITFAANNLIPMGAPFRKGEAAQQACRWFLV